MSNRTKGVWGENPKRPSKSDIPGKKFTGPVKPVQSRTRHGRPIKPEVSDAGCLFFLIFLFEILMPLR